jgi:hypothetical protein
MEDPVEGLQSLRNSPDNSESSWSDEFVLLVVDQLHRYWTEKPSLVDDDEPEDYESWARGRLELTDDANPRDIDRAYQLALYQIMRTLLQLRLRTLVSAKQTSWSSGTMTVDQQIQDSLEHLVVAKDFLLAKSRLKSLRAQGTSAHDACLADVYRWMPLDVREVKLNPFQNLIMYLLGKLYEAGYRRYVDV